MHRLENCKLVHQKFGKCIRLARKMHSLLRLNAPMFNENEFTATFQRKTWMTLLLSYLLKDGAALVSLKHQLSIALNKHGKLSIFDSVIILLRSSGRSEICCIPNASTPRYAKEIGNITTTWHFLENMFHKHINSTFLSLTCSYLLASCSIPFGMGMSTHWNVRSISFTNKVAVSMHRWSCGLLNWVLISPAISWRYHGSFFE